MLAPCSQAQRPEHGNTSNPWMAEPGPLPALPGMRLVLASDARAPEPPNLAVLGHARASEGHREPWSRTPSPAGPAALALPLQARGAAEDSQVCRIITTTCQVLLLRYFTPEICYIKGH